MAARGSRSHSASSLLMFAFAIGLVACSGRDPSGKPSLSTLKREMAPFSENHPGSLEFNDRGELLMLFLRPEYGYVNASSFDTEAKGAGWKFEKKRETGFWSIAKYSKGRMCLSLESREGSPSEITMSWSSNPVSWNYCKQNDGKSVKRPLPP